MENVLKVENLKYQNVLKDITFSLEEKSFNILIGANSSGKTTIVNCIRGLVEYTGNIYLLNNLITKKNVFNLHKECGFFTDGDVFLENNVFDELLKLLKNLDYTEDKAKKKIYSVVKKLNLTHVLFKYEKDLSIYEKTMVSFIFSIIHDPRLLIIDNDLETLDEAYKNKIFNYLKSQKKLTILFITTNSEYFSMAEKILFLKEGKIVLTGSLKEVLNDEKLFIKCGTELPFCVDLSNKLIAYELLDCIEFDIEKMVNKIWK